MNYSIIIPHKNTPELLGRLLESIPEQDDIQVIVVDDNSDADKIATTHRKNVEIVLLDATQSKGAGRARNVGIEKAQGNWLIFADSDDYFTPNFIDVINKYKDSSSEMIIFKAISVNSDTLEPSDRHVGLNRKIEECINGKISTIEMSLSVQQPWCRMIKNDFVKKNMIIFDEVIASNDTMFTTKCSCLAKKIDVSEDIIYVVTYRGGSLWNTRKNPDNYMARILVAINRSIYLRQKGYQTIPLIVPYIQYGYINIKSNTKALYLICKNKVLFSGLFPFLLKQISKRLSN